jgi:hypothetical protein
MNYLITYVKVDRWEKGGTQLKKETFDSIDKAKERIRQLSGHIRIGSIKLYELKN